MPPTARPPPPAANSLRHNLLPLQDVEDDEDISSDEEDDVPDLEGAQGCSQRAATRRETSGASQPADAHALSVLCWPLVLP